MLVSPCQPENTPSPIVVSDDGKSIFMIAKGHTATQNICRSSETKDVELISMLTSEVQPSNTPAPSEASDGGRTMLVSELQEENASFPIAVTFVELRSMLVSELQEENARSLIAVTPSGSVGEQLFA